MRLPGILTPRKATALFVLISFIVAATLVVNRPKRLESEYVTVNNPDGSSVTLEKSAYDKLPADLKSSGGVVDGNTLHPCSGNPQDQCKGAPAIDFYPGGREDASNPDFKGDLTKAKDVMGSIESIEDRSVTLRTTSGRLFTVIFPLDAVTDFNTNRSPHYNNIKVTIDDTLHVTYTDVPDSATTTISPQQLFRSSLLLKDHDPKKTNNIEKY